MSSVATSLARSVPKPKYNGDSEELPGPTQSKGPRIFGAGSVDGAQVLLQVVVSYRTDSYIGADISYVAYRTSSLWF